MISAFFSLVCAEALIGLLCGFATPPSANAATEAQLLRSGPCAPLLAKYCPEPEISSADILKCLEAHRAQRSEACNDDMQPILLDIEKVPEKCRADVKEVCAKAGEGQVMKCLKQNHIDLSPQCRVALEDRNS
jgi:hypothetical protein